MRDRNVLPLGVAKHPVANTLFPNNILSILLLIYPVGQQQEFFSFLSLNVLKAVGWSANILSTMAGDELEIPLVEFRGIHRKRYTISLLDAKNFPFASSLLILVNLSEDVYSEQPVGFTLHRTTLFYLARLHEWWSFMPVSPLPHAE